MEFDNFSEVKWDATENEKMDISKYKKNFMERFSSSIISWFESSFYWYGQSIGKRPVSFILFCLVITLCCSTGIVNFTKEERPFKLWIPQNSDFIKVMDWQMKNFPQDFRLHMAIYEADNVLDSKVIQEMYRIHESVLNITTENSTNWQSVCAKIPATTGFLFGKKKRSIAKRKLYKQKRQSNWLQYLTREDYCYLLETLPQECLEHSILEIWGYNKEIINALSNEKILHDVNVATSSAVFGIPTNFSSFLGNIEHDINGLIIKAKATRQIWITQVDSKMIANGSFEVDKGSSMPVDSKGFQWETELIKTVLNETERQANVQVYFMAAASFGLVADSTIMGDLKLLGLGFFVVFIYVQVMLGKFNLVEQRPLLSLCGISCVWLAMGVSYGICSMLSIPFGPVNNVLPFLLLGLGVDDMFVIVQSWNNLTEDEKEADLPNRIGFALKHSGVSITVTSLTDIAAFTIGCTTVLPGLRSFCLYAAIGILAIYFFQATFFVAWFTLDQRRLEEKRQGLFWCCKLNNWTPNKCSQRDLCQTFFRNILSKFLLKTSSKVVVLIFSFLLLGFSLFGLYNLQQEFNPIWFLPQSTYLYKFFIKIKEHFPSNGEDGIVYFGNVSIVDNLQKIHELTVKLKENEYISSVDSWLDSYQDYWMDQGLNALEIDGNTDTFNDELSEFLHSPSGSKYRVRNFKFSEALNCTEPIPTILASSIEFKHQILSGSKEQIIARNMIKDIVKSMNFSGYVQPWARAYSMWETDEIIEVELYRNIGLALIVVFIMTLMLISSMITSLLVLLCVVMTLVDVGALMHWWGLTIDVVSCVDLVLAVGLCVDYAAHIGHSFLSQKGTRNNRARDALSKIGPAVLNGGFSTMLAFFFLAGSDSHVFKSFFKIFFAVCLYGLYHGLIFLPVLLSLIGPSSYDTVTIPIKSSIRKGGDEESKHINGTSTIVSDQDFGSQYSFRLENFVRTTDL